MSNNWDDKKARHKVTLTRPFWVSKFCVTTAQWREFDEGYVADCLPIEKALKGDYPLSKRVTRPQFDAFCKFLTQKYRSRIPEGYVFRLPSDAEWLYAFDEESFYMRHGKACRSVDGAEIGEKFKAIQKQYKLEKLANWASRSSFGWSSWFFVGGLLVPHTTGVCDMFTGGQHVLDVFPTKCTRIDYFDEEVDPFRYTSSQTGFEQQRGNPHKWSFYDDVAHAVRIAHMVLGPDLIKEKAWNNLRKNIEDNRPAPNRSYAWNPAKVPKMASSSKSGTGVGTRRREPAC